MRKSLCSLFPAAALLTFCGVLVPHKTALAALPGDMYLSKKLQGLCVAVKGAAAQGAALGVEACDPDDPLQRWEHQGGSLRLAGSSWCLGATALTNGAKPQLQACSTNPQPSWSYTNESFVAHGLALDLTADNDLVLWGLHGFPNQRWLTSSSILAQAQQEHTTVISYPIAVSRIDLMSMDRQRDAANRLTPLSQPLPFPRNVSNFPGEVPDSAARISAEFRMDRRVNRFSHPGWTPAWRHTLHTGLWAPAGAIIRVEASSPATNGAEGLRVRIGTHTDVLRTDGQLVNGDSQLRRYPEVSTTRAVKLGAVELRSQYGGFVVIESDYRVEATIDLKVAGAVRGAYFNTMMHRRSEWEAIKALPSPWVTIEGQRAVITVPKSQVVGLTDPVSLIHFYDNHVNRIQWLAGLDGTSPLHPLTPRLRQHLLWDPQIINGFAHAGYPIMVTSTWALADPEKARTEWGNVHEIGHNYQPFELWCSAFGIESTVNLFSLYALEQEGVASRLVAEGMYKKAVDKLNAGTIKSFATDAGVWDKLVFLMQIKAAFPAQGWDIFRRLNRAYRELPEAEQLAILDSRPLQYDKNYELLSRITGHDLVEHYQNWGVPLSAAALARVRALNLPMPAQPIWNLVPIS